VRLALVSRRYPPWIGGAERALGYLAPALAEAGAEVTVLTSRPPGFAGPAEEVREAGKGRLRVVRLAGPPVRFAGTLWYMLALRRWFARHAVDLAYVSMLKHDAYVTAGAGARHGFPVVLRPEGAGATGDLAWQGWGRFGRTIAARCRRADAVVAISPAVAAELLAAGYDPAKVHDLPNGVPVPEPSWNRRADWRAAPRAVFLGRLAPEKGLDTLVDAWPAVLKSFKTARLSLVGEGPERVAIAARIDRLGLRNSVDLPGPTDDPTARLREADLFILPSREEGMSVALLEAMAVGVPLVASAIPGNRRLVQDFTHGRLAAPDDPAALARTIIDQWSHFDRAFHMTRAARRRVADEFSVGAVARRHLELFRALVARPPGRAGRDLS